MAAPKDITRTLRAAETQHRAGKLREADALYREVLKQQPRHAHALHGIGLIMLQVGRADAAAQMFERAITIDPMVAEFFNHMGAACRRLGRPADAIGYYRRALLLQPDHADAHRNLGVALHEAGQPDQAVEQFRRTLVLKPDFWEAMYNLGYLLNSRGSAEEALAIYLRGLEIQPLSAPLHTGAGIALSALGRTAEAVAHYERALSAQPDYAEARLNLGMALGELGRTGEAMACHDRVLATQPAYAEAHNASGVLLAATGRVPDAIARFRRTLELKPQFFDAHVNLGNALFEIADLGGAEAAFRSALSVTPGDIDARTRLANVRQHLCDWRDDGELAAARPAGDRAFAGSPFMLLASTDSPSEQLVYARQWASRHLASLAEAGKALGFGVRREPKQRLRIGYLSADFHNHATAYLLAELFELHSRENVEVIGYSYGPDDGSAMRRRVVAACDRFVDIASSSHAEAAQAIHRDGIDILVDLKGHTRGARAQIPAMRPAPLQVSYLGYPGTMGADCFDYIITDRFIVPPGSEQFYAEKLACLPDCYQPNDRRRAVADASLARTDYGLPADGFVFCCFNNSYKINAEVFEVWMRLLHQVPGSVLWLLEGHPQTRSNLEREAEMRGIAAGRLVFAPRLASAEHLARHRCADLFLDTLPCNAHTTASDALWAGLPLLTCAGQTFCSRVAGSLLHAVGIPELVTESLSDYETLALRLAGAPHELSRLRARLAENRPTAPLFDTPRYARHLERAFRIMWDRHAGGGPPEMFEVPREPDRRG